VTKYIKIRKKCSSEDEALRNSEEREKRKAEDGRMNLLEYSASTM
jgi:hypothetical protein